MNYTCQNNRYEAKKKKKSALCYRQSVSFLRGHIDEIGGKWGPQCLLQNKGQLTRNMSSDGTAYTFARV